MTEALQLEPSDAPRRVLSIGVRLIPLRVALGGRVDGSAGFAPGMKGQIDAGKLRVLAVFQQGKYDLLPDAKPIGER